MSEKPDQSLDFKAESAALADWCKATIEALVPELWRDRNRLVSSSTAEAAMMELIARMARLGLADSIRRIRLVDRFWSAKDAIAELAEASRLARSTLAEHQARHAATDTEGSPTEAVRRSDNAKNNRAQRRIRPMSAAAARCAKAYRKAKSQDPGTTMRQIVQEYIERHGGSANTILRVLNDHPGQWKHDHKTTKMRPKDDIGRK